MQMLTWLKKYEAISVPKNYDWLFQNRLKTMSDPWLISFDNHPVIQLLKQKGQLLHPARCYFIDFKEVKTKCSPDR